MSAPQLVSIQSGLIRLFPLPQGVASTPQYWESAIIKTPVVGSVSVDSLGLAGDKQASTEFHGGVDKALLGYSAEHYPRWLAELKRSDFQPGAFGENLLIAGLDESNCCLGDVHRIGDCELEISQPRQPCWKLSKRWDLPELANLVRDTGRTGWYYRVLRSGIITTGLPVEVIARPFPEWTVARALQVFFSNPHNPRQDLLLANCPALSEAWRTPLLKRAQQSTDSPNC